MLTQWSRCRHAPSRPARSTAQLHVEQLETRFLLAVSVTATALGEERPDDTLDQSQALGPLSPAVPLTASGRIGDGVGGGADVDWYRFTLAAPGQVSLAAVSPGSGTILPPVLSLYNAAPPNFLTRDVDPFNPLGHRLLAQVEAGGGAARLERALAPGTYYVALSGAGNRFFHPFLAGSGTEGATGDYRLLLTTTTDSAAAAAPFILASDPAQGAVLGRSPFVLRLAVSLPLDPTTVTFNPLLPNQTVQLTYNPTGRFGDGNDQTVVLGAGTRFSRAASELQLVPLAPLARGHYRLVLAGDESLHPVVLKGLDGKRLGESATSPRGQDFTLTFRIDGVEGGAGANDTPATARVLGELAGRGLIQLTGAVGDDPAYNPTSTDPTLANRAADVDLYHFRLSGPGPHAFIAEVFAGRIGSPLDPGVTLFRLDPADGRLRLVGVNDSTLNNTLATNRSSPLLGDAVLYAGLGAGDYYLAVSGTGNLPDPGLGLLPGMSPVFDPEQTHSGLGGFTTGEYVLNLLAVQDTQAPRVLAVTPAEGSLLDGPPSRLTVQFSEPVNLQHLAYQAALKGEFLLPAVSVRGSDGVAYFPRLESYDAATNTATFLMLDALPAGENTLHLSGALGLADLAGNPLTGNDPAGHQVTFTVGGPPRGTDGNPQLWTSAEPNDSLALPQDLGVLFPRELQNTVTIQRDYTGNPAAAPQDSADYYRFEVLQARSYILTLSGTGLPTGTRPRLTTDTGQALTLRPLLGGRLFLVSLTPGTYVLSVGGWTPAQAARVTYRLTIRLSGSLENPAPLTVGPAPAFRLRLVIERPPVAAPPPGTAPPPAAPSLPAPPAERLVLPGTPTSVGVVPVAVADGSGGLFVSLGIPPGVLASLSAAPVGGVRGSDPASPVTVEAFRLPGVEAPAAAEPFGLGTLTSSGDDATAEDQLPPGGGDDEPPGDEQAPARQEGPQVPAELWKRAVDVLFGAGWQGSVLRYWLRLLAAPSNRPLAPAPAAPEEVAPDREAAGDGAAGAAAPEVLLERAECAWSGSGLAGVVLAAGALSTAHARQRSARRRPGTRSERGA